MEKYVAPEKKTASIFPGCGKYFHWELGVAQYLNEHYDLSNTDFIGASAGAIASVFAACNIDPTRSTNLTVELMNKYNVYDRNLGLVGVWGKIVAEWLDLLLPENAAELCDDRVSKRITLVRKS